MQHKTGIKGKNKRVEFNRIIAAVLVAAMAVVCLAGCSFGKAKAQTVSEDTVSEDILPDEDSLQGTVRTVIIGIDESTGNIKFSHVDTGKKYDPLSREDPDVTLSAEEREEGGLGIYMVKKTMDESKYEYRNGYNIFTIMKKIKE